MSHETHEVDRPSTETIQVLVDNHREFLRFLERRLQDRALAEDILQDAFVRGIERIGSLRDDESAVAWFYRALRNAVVDHHRRSGASSRTLARFADEITDEHEPPPSDVAVAVCACVTRLAGTLKPEYAELLLQVDVGGRAVKDFATDHGITSGNAAVRAHRARDALRKQVMRSCGTCAEHGCYQCSCGA